MLIFCGLVLGVGFFCFYRNSHRVRTERVEIQLGTRWISLVCLGLCLNFNLLHFWGERDVRDLFIYF